MPTPPSAEDFRRLDAYLARVRTLSAAEWGRLDAIGVRLADNTPWARLRRARLDADLCGPIDRLLPRPVLVGGAAVVRAATDVGRWLGTQPTPDPLAPPRRHVSSPGDPRAPEPSAFVRGWEAYREHLVTGLAELRRLARAAPATGRAADGGGAAARVLELGLESLWRRALPAHLTDRQAAGRLYALVEPVIPFASLDGTPRLTGGG